MAGNVWEWTRSIWGITYDVPEFTYPYDLTNAKDREDLTADGDVNRILRGGAYSSSESSYRTAARANDSPNDRDPVYGFRVVVLLPISSK
ncbi:MAG: sulfatase activating formylglycine-generating enzyme [Cellvibrionaceae bacterium]|jgi:formylglycine-generating enzyme required for sulfatase activity